MCGARAEEGRNHQANGRPRRHPEQRQDNGARARVSYGYGEWGLRGALP